MSLTSSLDLSRLLLFHSALSTVTAAAVAPTYNLPIFLYGLYAVDKGTNGEFGADSLRQFTILLGLSFVLDLLWLYNWSSAASGFIIFLILVNFVVKPISLLACLTNLRQRGEPTLSFNGIGSFGGGGAFGIGRGGGGGAGGFGNNPGPDENVWQPPANFNASGGGHASYQGSVPSTTNPPTGPPGRGVTPGTPYQSRQPYVEDEIDEGSRGGGKAAGEPGQGGGYHTLE